MGALAIMDLAHYLATDGEVRIVVSRDVRVHRDAFPLKAPNPLRELQCAEVMARLFNAPRAATLADLLDKGDGLCVVCDRPVSMVVVDCPGCRGSHRAHTRDAR